jgi:hypothetical protein
VVGKMPCDDIGQGADGDWIPARDAGPGPCVLGQVAEERESGCANGAELLDVAGPRNVIGSSERNGDFLIEARQRGLEAAREPQGSV